MKLNGNAVKPGNVIEHNGRLWTAVKVSHVKPGKGGAFAQEAAQGAGKGGASKEIGEETKK